MSVTVYAVGGDDGYGYIVNARGVVVNQDNMPGVGSDGKMTQDQATKFATLVEQKILGKLTAAVTHKQVADILAGRSVSAIIADERAGVM